MLFLIGLSPDSAPSWQSLRARVAATPTGARLEHESDLRSRGLGPPNAAATLRLFDAPSPSDVRVKLYRDAAAWCPYCQKVWLMLEERRIPYSIETVPLNAYGYKPPSFTRLVDGGKLPALELDGRLHVESLSIMRLLDTTFPAADSSSSDDSQRVAELFTLEEKLQRDYFSLVFYPVEQLEPFSKLRLSALNAARDSLLSTLREVDEVLSATDGPWFLGGVDAPSIIDFHFIVCVERMCAATLYWKGLKLRGKDGFITSSMPHLERWINAFEERESYLATKADYYSIVLALPSQNGPGYSIPEAEGIASRITGLDGAWSVDGHAEEENEDEPLAPLQLLGGAEAARHEAAYALCINHEAITCFAARGASEPGRPSFHAELADPNAEPNEELIEPVDVALRHVCAKLLSGTDDEAVITRDASSDLAGSVDPDVLMDGWDAYEDESSGRTYWYEDMTGETRWSPPTGQLDACLAYLRDRIGVPRDVNAAAARPLRATLNWARDLSRAEEPATKVGAK